MAKQAAEKPEDLGEISENHPSVAKATADSIGLTRGLKPPSPSVQRFSAAGKAVYLVDVNLLIARLFEGHEHHDLATEWFQTPGLQWALCPWAEAGFLRFATRPGRLSMSEATGLLEQMELHPGYHYHTCAANWRALTKPYFRRLHGHKQVTDAYLLGMAIADDLILATFDKRIGHLAGEHDKQVLVLGA